MAALMGGLYGDHRIERAELSTATPNCYH